jgi:nucleoside-diphosphate-sugar epimerase
MSRVLVTGANGFVGRELCATLQRRGFAVRAAVRDISKASALPDVATVGDIDAVTDWSGAVQNVDTVIHAAARAHILRDSPANAELYMRTNAEGTAALAAAASSAGVRRFILVSSIKVNGEATSASPFKASDTPNPQDEYGRSKLAAERALLEMDDPNMQRFVVRPPLVYGNGVRANFLRLVRMVDRGLPLPVGAVDNARSLVSVWNLADLLAHLVEAEARDSNVFLVSDGVDLSTPALIRQIAAALGRRARLPSVPVPLLRFAAAVFGKQDEVDRLCGSLRVDVAPTCRALKWTPPMPVEEGLARTISWYRREGNCG